MPTRRTVSRSYRGLFGTRVRYTTTQTVGPRQPNVQVHLTGRDLIEMQRQQAEAVAQARAEESTAQAQHMATLNGAALWLHTPIGAIVTMGVFVVGLALGLWLNFPLLLIGLPIALAVIDWRNFSSFHGAIPWKVWQVEGKNGRWWTLAIVLWLYGWLFMPAVYAIQAWMRADEVRAMRHAKLDAQIAALEAAVLPPASPPASPAPAIPPPPPPIVPLVPDDTTSPNP